MGSRFHACEVTRQLARSCYNINTIGSKNHLSRENISPPIILKGTRSNGHDIIPIHYQRKVGKCQRSRNMDGSHHFLLASNRPPTFLLPQDVVLSPWMWHSWGEELSLVSSHRKKIVAKKDLQQAATVVAKRNSSKKIFLNLRWISSK